MIVADGSPPPQRDQLGACTLDVTTTFEGQGLAAAAHETCVAALPESRKDSRHDRR